jgi:hypothetical protein
MTTLAEQVKELQAQIEELKTSSSNDDRFQGVWMQEGKNGKYAGAMVVSPQGEKMWICIFPNKYYKKKGNRPAYHVTLDAPKEDSK